MVNNVTEKERERERTDLLQWKAAVLPVPDQLCYFMFFFVLILTYFVDYVSAIVSYDQKQLLDIRTAITNLNLDKGFESEAQDILLTPDNGPNPKDPQNKKAE